MAKIGIQTWGSNGDIRPLLALGGGLQQAGHSVTLVASSIDDRNYACECQRLNIEYRHIPEAMYFDLPAFAQDTYKMNTIQWLMALLEAVFFPFEQEIYLASQQLVAENDVLIGHHFLYPLKIAATKQNKPYITVTYCQGAIVTKTLPPFKFPNLGSMLNRQQWKILNQTLDWTLKKRLGKLWFEEGLPTFKHVYPSLLTSDLLNLVAVDPLLCSELEEWSPVHQACGFLNLSERAETWSMPTALHDFLASGDAPVYMTFGSLQQAVPEWSMELFVAATKLSGCRAVIQTSSEKYPANSQVENIYFMGRHPHQPVFKQCVAVVHHGGAGTTHSALLSGCASVVVPFMDEQLFWGRKLQQAGLAGEPLASNKADAETLAERIKIVLSTKSMQQAAEISAQEMQGRDGVIEAVKLIGEVL